MKIVISVVFICLFTLKVHSQTVNNVPLSEIKSEYIEIYSGGTSFSKYLIICLDYGQGEKAFSDRTVLSDEKGSDRFLYSMIDAINYLSQRGYEFVQAYTGFDAPSPNTKYIFKKK